MSRRNIRRRCPRRTPYRQDHSPTPFFIFGPGDLERKPSNGRLENWLRLANQFVNWGIDVVLTGSVQDRKANDAFLAQVPMPARMHLRSAAGMRLNETAAVLANSSMVVSVDTGIMHLASALGAPLVALHGPTSARRGGPLGSRTIAVESPLGGCGYIRLGWESTAGRPACMESIRYEAVRDACLCLLKTEHGAGALRSAEGLPAQVQT